jgi:hypothetical protein
MGAVVEDLGSAIGGIVEGAGKAVEDIGKAVDEVATAVDTYVIKPIEKDPVQAIAMAAAAAYLGPMAATAFGTSAAVGTGIAVGGAKTAYGLSQGKEFDQALKEGAVAGVTAGAIHGAVDYFTTPEIAPYDYDTPISGQKYLDSTGGGDVNVAPELDLSGGPDVAVEPPAPIQQTAPEVPLGPEPAPTSPLATYQQASPTLDAPFVEPVSLNAPAFDYEAFNLYDMQGPGYPEIPQLEITSDLSIPSTDLSAGLKPYAGDSTGGFSYNRLGGDQIPGDLNYDLTPTDVTGAGLQPPSSPSIPAMGGGTGVTAPVEGLDPFEYKYGAGAEYEGQPANWQTEAGYDSGVGKTYGQPTPDGTVSARSFTPDAPRFSYGPTENVGELSAWEKLTRGDLGGATKDAGTGAWDYAKEVAKANPWTTAAGLAIGADYLANPPKEPDKPTKTTGATKDSRFTKSLDLYNYVRDRANYKGDLTKYGQKGQGGEQQFFQNERFVPIPIPQTTPTPVKTGGLIHMKHFAQGGQMQDPRMQGSPQMDPRRAQMMQAMAQQRPAGMGSQQMPSQGGLQQGMQPAPRPQMPQRPRDPKMAYYQYGNPPARGMAMGGLNQVHSMKIGGGADGRSDDVNAVLSDGEYVMDAETVAMLGNGSSKAGAAQLDQMRANLRKQKGQALARGEISPDARSPLSYLKGA